MPNWCDNTLTLTHPRKKDSDKLEGSGAFDHIAFRAKDYKKILTILEENKISYFKRTVPGMNLFQIFVKDPNGITIELNYFK